MSDLLPSQRTRDAVRAQAQAAMSPVAPLKSPATRALLVAAGGLAGAAALVAMNGPRPALGAHGWFVGALAAGGALASWAAMRLAVPARGPGVTGRLLLLAAPLLFAAAVLARGIVDGPAVHPVCLPLSLAAALPAAALAALFLRRGFPTAPRLAGVAAGAAAGLWGLAAISAVCPLDVTAHVLLFHGSALVILMALGVTIASRRA